MVITHGTVAISETAKLQQKAEYENQIPTDPFNLGLLHLYFLHFVR